MFGPKPAFGAPGATTAGTGGLFGSGGAASGAGAFGTPSAAPGSAIGFGGAAGTTLPMQGTATVPYVAFSEKEGNSTTMNYYQTIAFMPAYKNWSLEVCEIQSRR